MSKNTVSNSSKIGAFVKMYQKEFSITPKNELYCKLCNIIINHQRKFVVQKHQKTWKHLKKIESGSDMIQTFITDDKKCGQHEYGNLTVKAFLSANIPLYKINNKKLRDLFSYLGKDLPSLSTLRSLVPSIAEEEIQLLRRTIMHKKVFIVIDESDINGKKFVNVLIGLIDNPKRTYLLDCNICNVSINHQYISYLIDDLIKCNDIDRNNFCLLLSDAASYMVAAGNMLKSMYPQLLHVTCVSHLYHNCAEKIRGYYNNVDYLISRIKALIIKNKDIGIPPEPVVTRWASWLKAALYYAENLPAVRSIINCMDGEGIILRNAKNALSDRSLAANLLAIKRDYENLINLVIQSENPSYTMLKAYQDVTSVSFDQDSCNIKKYINKRLEKNSDLVVINKLLRDDIAPSQYQLLQQCPASSASVERSFSMLKKMLAKDRPFKDENIKLFCFLL